MNTHPETNETLLYWLRVSALPAGAKILDLGAGSGNTVELLCKEGFSATGIDRQPAGEYVRQGDILSLPCEDESFDALVSQCAFFSTGNVEKALKEAFRVLRPGGRFLLSDVFFSPPLPLLTSSGFRLLASEDITPQWREHYFAAVFRGETMPCLQCLPKEQKKLARYWLLFLEKP